MYTIRHVCANFQHAGLFYSLQLQVAVKLKAQWAAAQARDLTDVLHGTPCTV